MLDTFTPSLQRSRGAAAVVLAADGGRTRIARLAQAGSAKAFLPRSHAADTEVVYLNTSGGLTGGDRLSYQLDVGDGVAVTGTTQTAERAYRAGPGVAEVSVRLSAGAGARLDWLPQETILFDGAGLARRTEVDLAEDAAFLMVETLVLGRAAMGETVAALDLADRRIIRRGGRPMMVEPVRLTAAALTDASAAGLGPARALSTLVFTAPGAEDALGPVRSRLDAAEVPAAASAWDGRLVVRAMAPAAQPLRLLVADLLTQLRGRPLPRVWQV